MVTVISNILSLSTPFFLHRLLSHRASVNNLPTSPNIGGVTKAAGRVGGGLMLNYLSKCKYVVLAALFMASGSAFAEIPDVPAYFPTHYSCTPGQLLSRHTGMGRVTNIVYHNGHIYTNNVESLDETAREFRFSDIDDPGSFEQVFTPNLQSMPNARTHGHTKVGDYVVGYQKIGYRRIGVGVNEVDFSYPADWIKRSDQPPPPGVQNLAHSVFYPWSLPFNWLQYNPESTGSARLYRAKELLAEWEPWRDDNAVGYSLLLGNFLFIMSDSSMNGIAAYDISPVFNTPARPPRLIDKLPDVGGYLGAIWENYLLLAGGANNNLLYVVDISDPSNMELIKTFDLPPTAGLSAGNGKPYVQTQDEYIFTRRHKIDMTSLESVLEFDEVGDNRPAGGVSGRMNISQYNLPVGNLMISGGSKSVSGGTIGVWCHQSRPDTRGPYVGYHIPRNGQTHFPLGAPISLVIAEELESFTIVNGESIIVRPVGGQAIDAWTSFSHDGILTFTPKEYLLPDTSYEVIIPAGGIKDISGNGIDEYSFTFSTGHSVVNSGPVIHGVTSSRNPSHPDETVLFTVDATDAEFDELEYRFDFSGRVTRWSTSPSASHLFTQSGNFDVKAQVRDIKPNGTSTVTSKTVVQTVTLPAEGLLPVSSSMLALDDFNRVVWTVNPDNDSVSQMDADAQFLLNEIDLRVATDIDKPIRPSSIAIDLSGRAWIVARDANLIIVLNSQGDLLRTIDTGYGSRPQAIVISQDGSKAFVSVTGRGESDPGNGQLLRYSTHNFSQTGRLELGKHPRAMALSGNGDRLFVAAFISAVNHGTIWEIDSSQMTIIEEIKLQRDRGVPGLDLGGSDGPGVPNYIADLVISPDNRWLWYTAIKADTNRGQFFAQQSNPDLILTPDSTLRSMLGRVDLSLTPPREPEFEHGESLASRIDIDNTDSPSSLAFSPAGNYAFVTLQGNDTLAAFDEIAIRQGTAEVTSMWRTATGFAPQASLMDATNNRLWIKNLISRDVSVVDLDPFISTGSAQLTTTSIPTVQMERLAPDVLEGKRSFYFAGNDDIGLNDMSSEGYISCASCHLDGSHDGRVWDFSQRGEGFRNTTDLRGREGTGHGNVHWSANFDEIQDFVLDMVNHFGGRGFLAEGEVPNTPLGASNSLNIELDQLSAYVTSLGKESIPQNPSD